MTGLLQRFASEKLDLSKLNLVNPLLIGVFYYFRVLEHWTSFHTLLLSALTHELVNTLTDASP